MHSFVVLITLLGCQFFGSGAPSEIQSEVRMRHCLAAGWSEEGCEAAVGAVEEWPAQSRILPSRVAPGQWR